MATSLTSLNAKQGDINIVVGGANLLTGGVGQNMSIIYQPLGIPSMLVNGANVPANPATGTITLQSAGGTIKITNTAGVFTFTDGATGGGGAVALVGSTSLLQFTTPTGTNNAMSIPPIIPTAGTGVEDDYALATAQWVITAGAVASATNLYFDFNFSVDTISGFQLGQRTQGVIQVSGWNTSQVGHLVYNLGSFTYYLFPQQTSGADSCSVSGVITLSPAQITAMGLPVGGILSIALQPSCGSYLTGVAQTPIDIALVFKNGQIYPVI